MILFFSTGQVCFSLVPQPKHSAFFLKQSQMVDSRWAGQIQTFTHEISDSTNQASPSIRYERWMGKGFREILIEGAGKEALQELADEGFRVESLGSCHAIWPRQKHILKQKYGIDWISPKEQNPHILID